jgi:23S rRNA pseudouridine2605 synthase
MKERIQKILGGAGVASRREVERMVLEGRIAVNGKIVSRLPILVDPDEDRVEVDSQLVRLRSEKGRKRAYFIMNKPKGVYSTNVAQGVQTRAIDLLPPNLRERVYPVGRLDAESRGLLLLTNDGELTQRLTHPKYGVPKTYRVVVDGFVEPGAIDTLQKGVWLADESGHGFHSGRSQIRVVKRGRYQSILEITLREGKNREVRRILARLGHKVRDLVRIRIGPLSLEGLAPGQSRRLTEREVRLLWKAPRDDEKRPKGQRPRRGSRPPQRGGDADAASGTGGTGSRGTEPGESGKAR